MRLSLLRISLKQDGQTQCVRKCVCLRVSRESKRKKDTHQRKGISEKYPKKLQSIDNVEHLVSQTGESTLRC